MFDATLTARSPLEGLALPSGPQFTLSEAPPAARFILRGGEAVRVACGMVSRRAAVATWSGAEGDKRAALWLGPDEWLLIASVADVAAVADVLEQVLEGTAHSLVDISHRQIGLVASGPAAARVLDAGCPLALDLKAFPVGFATRTVFDKAEIVLWRRAEATFHVEVWRSLRLISWACSPRPLAARRNGRRWLVRTVPTKAQRRLATPLHYTDTHHALAGVI